jgi:hypothetical protein
VIYQWHIEVELRATSIAEGWAVVSCVVTFVSAVEFSKVVLAALAGTRIGVGGALVEVVHVYIIVLVTVAEGLREINRVAERIAGVIGAYVISCIAPRIRLARHTFTFRIDMPVLLALAKSVVSSTIVTSVIVGVKRAWDTAVVLHTVVYGATTQILILRAIQIPVFMRRVETTRRIHITCTLFGGQVEAELVVPTVIVCLNRIIAQSYQCCTVRVVYVR